MDGHNPIFAFNFWLPTTSPIPPARWCGLLWIAGGTGDEQIWRWPIAQTQCHSHVQFKPKSNFSIFFLFSINLFKEFFKFGRKPTVSAKGARTNAEVENSSGMPEASSPNPSTSTTGTNLRYRKSGGSGMGGGRGGTSCNKDADRRKSLGASASAAAISMQNTASTPGEGGQGINGNYFNLNVSNLGGPRLSSAALVIIEIDFL